MTVLFQVKKELREEELLRIEEPWTAPKWLENLWFGMVAALGVVYILLAWSA